MLTEESTELELLKKQLGHRSHRENLELSSSCWFSCCEVSRDFQKVHFLKKADKKWLFENSFANLAGQTTHLYTFEKDGFANWFG